VWFAWVLVAGVSSPAAAQTLDGAASVMVVAFADHDNTPARSPLVDLRPRLFVEGEADVNSVLRLTAAGFVEGLAASNEPHNRSRRLVGRVQELHAEFRGSKADLRIGLSRIQWGRLDEFVPTDVVNPIDVARFFMESRAEARLSVPLIRARLTGSDRFGVEAVYVPLFERGRFDQVGEASSPFNLAPPIPTVDEPPEAVWRNGQGGVRVNATTGRVDWAVVGYRGYEPFPIYELETAEDETQPVVARGHFPRFDMFGGDFETVRGKWGLRGEFAWFFNRTLQSLEPLIQVEGQVVQAGVGIDRRAGNYRIGATLLTSRRQVSSETIDAEDTLVVLVVDRSFARETRQLRTFAAYDTTTGSVFARAIGTIALRDNFILELSAALFDGQKTDMLSRLRTRDFGYARLKFLF
jgi:hypothetical protein